METMVACTAVLVAAAGVVCVCLMGLIGEIRMLPDRIWERFQMGHQAAAADVRANKRESLG